MKPWLLQCFPLARGTRSWPRDGVPSGQLRPQPGLWFSERQLQAPSIHPPSMGQPGRSGWCGKGRGRCSHQKRVLGTEPQRPRRHAWGRGHTGPEMRPLVTGPLAGCDCRSVRATGSVWSGSGGAPALCACPVRLQSRPWPPRWYLRRGYESSQLLGQRLSVPLCLRVEI